MARAPLTGRIFDADGNPMSPTFSYGRRKKPYRYYVSAPLQQGQRRPAGDETIRRVPAPALEARLTGLLRRLRAVGSVRPARPADARRDPRATPCTCCCRRDCPKACTAACSTARTLAPDRQDPSQLRLVLPLRMQLHGGRTVIVGAADAPARPDPVLIKALRAAHAMLGRDAGGGPVLEAIPASPYHRRLLRLAFLAPELQRAILAGRQPAGLTLKQLLEQRLPLLWTEQVRVFGAAMPA